MHIEESQLKDFIIDSGLVSRADMTAAEKEAKESGMSVGKVLVSKGKLTDDDLRRMQAYILGIPFVDLKGEKLPMEVLSLIPEPIARNHNVVAFKKSDTALEVAMLDTEDLTAIDFIKKKVGLKILPRMTDNESMKSAILQYQKSLKADFGDLIQKDALALKSIPDAGGDEKTSEEDLKKLADDVPVVRIVDTLLKHAILQNASDIHIEPLEMELLVRYRIDGLLHDAMILPKNVAPSITARLKVLAALKLDEKRLPQDGRFKIDMNGEKTVMSLLRETVSGFTLE
jgi:type IV pilus assembly protein PilB